MRRNESSAHRRGASASTPDRRQQRADAPAFRDAMLLVRNAGTVVIVGVAEPSTTLPLSPYEVYRRELTVRGRFTRRLSFDRAMNRLPHLNVEPLLTHVFPLDAVTEAMEHARTGQGAKVLVAP